MNRDADIKSINLNWKESELSQREHKKHVHGLHPYLGKFIPQIVEVLLRKYFRSGQVVFDPFSGSGTALVKAGEVGIHSVGSKTSENQHHRFALQSLRELLEQAHHSD